jgi:hypothetical protein
MIYFIFGFAFGFGFVSGFVTGLFLSLWRDWKRKRNLIRLKIRHSGLGEFQDGKD